MKIYYNSYDQMNNKKPITLTMGNFDGLHMGHQRLINRVLTYRDTKHAVLTFDPHPSAVLRDSSFKTLMQKRDKLDQFSALELDYAFVVKFDKQFSQLSVEEFIQFLKSINVKRLVIGRDARFGYRGQGTIKDLEKRFAVDVVPDLVYKNIRVSTTYIKDFLKNGDIEIANELLGNPYLIRGKIVHGNQIGKSLGFPTANVDYNHYFLPKVGVYYVNIQIDDKQYFGMANIGYNPTVNYSIEKRLEVHIFDFNDSVYNHAIAVTFIQFIRDEMKFKSKSILIKQLNKDRDTIKQLIDNKVMI